MNSNNAMIVGAIFGVILGAGGMAIVQSNSENCTVVDVDNAATSRSSASSVSSELSTSGSTVDSSDVQTDREAVQAYLDAANRIYTEAVDTESDGGLDEEARGTLQIRFSTALVNLENALTELSEKSASAATSFRADVNQLFANADDYFTIDADLKTLFSCSIKVTLSLVRYS